MDVIDKLRELTEAALRFDGEIRGDSFLLDMQAREQLISVALPLLLPMAEALERLLLAHSLACGESLTGAREGDEGRAVLTELEKALG